MSRARILGSNPRDFLVACACGCKVSVLKEIWQSRLFFVCDNCRSIISYTSLRVIGVREGGEGLGKTLVPTEEELLALREVEASAREFVNYYDENVREHRRRGFTGTPFSTGADRLVEALRPAFARLDAAREKVKRRRVTTPAAPT